jgi:transcriptional regulator with XRE-family HTH domain
MTGMGNRIKILRESKGLTQTDVAIYCGVTRAAIAQWEAADHVDIKLQPWLKLLELLSADPYWIVYGANKPKQGMRRSGET